MRKTNPKVDGVILRVDCWRLSDSERDAHSLSESVQLIRNGNITETLFLNHWFLDSCCRSVKCVDLATARASWADLP
ncbi:hypothetical protein M758_5G055400 [Ceratodon purpureus]|nr:hypothetical protein M758_5G055400 [Ceratodon purpureus]